MVPLFRARGLCKTYRVGEVDVHALQGLDLDLMEGEFVVILGPSGSGKSTLLNILGGLDSPSSGDVHFRDADLVRAGDRVLTRSRREHVGFVFHGPALGRGATTGGHRPRHRQASRRHPV
jgi:putative ABC transport system ATP-binding protein